MAMENPLCGSFNRERTILTFRQRSLEVYGAYLAIFGGAGMILIGVFRGFAPQIPLLVPSVWWTFFGACFLLAGVWAHLLFRQLRFDLRKRVYNERTSRGLAFWVRRGSMDEIRCLEMARFQGLIPTSGQPAQPYSWGGAMPQGGIPPIPAGSVLVVRLWWHDPRHAPVVVEHLVVGMGYGPQDQRTMHFLGLAQAYAGALRVPLYVSL
jgi:hypothetical protein